MVGHPGQTDVRVLCAVLLVPGYKYYGFNRGECNGQTGIWYREWAPGAKVGHSLGSLFNGCKGRNSHEAVARGWVLLDGHQVPRMGVGCQGRCRRRAPSAAAMWGLQGAIKRKATGWGCRGSTFGCTGAGWLCAAKENHESAVQVGCRRVHRFESRRLTPEWALVWRRGLSPPCSPTGLPGSRGFAGEQPKHEGWDLDVGHRSFGGRLIGW